MRGQAFAARARDAGLDRLGRDAEFASSLALVTYSENPPAVKAHAISGRFFAEDEVILELP